MSNILYLCQLYYIYVNYIISMSIILYLCQLYYIYVNFELCSDDSELKEHLTYNDNIKSNRLLLNWPVFLYQMIYYWITY